MGSGTLLLAFETQTRAYTRWIEWRGSR